MSSEMLAKINEIAAAQKLFIASQAKRLDDLEKRLNRPRLGAAATEEPREPSEYAKVFDRFLRRNVTDGLAGAFQASMSAGDDSNGGYTIPAELDTDIERYERDAVTMRGLATIAKLDNEKYEKLVRQGQAAAGWVDEEEERPETDTPDFASLKPYFGEVYANPGVTQRLLDDSGFNVAEFLAEEVGESFAEYENTAYITGNGVKKPRGILTYALGTAASVGTVKQIKSGASGVTTADKLIEVSLSLKPKYLKNARWLMSSATLLAIRLLKNAATGDYLLRAGLENGAPATLLGYPVALDETMPAPAADSHSIAFGDFKRAYLVGDVRGTRLIRDDVTRKGKVFFYTWKRTSGMVKDFTAYVVHTFGA
jgi:HK97 family phage major capsid protein